MPENPLFVTIEVDRDFGWTSRIVKRLPVPNNYYKLGYAEELFGLDLLGEIAGTVLIGTQSWDGHSQDQADTLRLLCTLHEQGYAGKVVYLTDRPAALDDKTPYEAAFPGVQVLSKTAVDNGSQPLFPF